MQQDRYRALMTRIESVKTVLQIEDSQLGGRVDEASRDARQASDTLLARKSS